MLLDDHPSIWFTWHDPMSIRTELYINRGPHLSSSLVIIPLSEILLYESLFSMYADVLKFS